MPVMLFKLRDVPDDEANDIRDLLSYHKIDFYETPAGRWGVSMEAIWLNDDTVLETARALIDEYQQQRAQRVRQEYQSLRQQGDVETFTQRLINRPIRTLSLVAVILTILYFVTAPFVKLTAN